MRKTISVMDAMTRTPVVVGPEMTLGVCARKMIAEKVGSLVVQENSLLRGIVTEKDFVLAVTKGLDMRKTRVKDVMSGIVFTVKPNKDVLEAIRLMAEKEVRRLPVVDEKNLLVGLVTVNDILRVQPQLLELVFEKRILSRPSIRPGEEDGECELCGSYTLLHVSGGKRVCEECD